MFEPEGVDVKYLVSDSDNQEQRPTAYDKKALKEKDKYQVFFGGNHAQVDITTTNDTTKRLLIFKDSYANCFVPFLIRITMRSSWWIHGITMTMWRR